MTHDRDFFISNTIDEQVDQLSQDSREGRLQRHERAGKPSEARLVEDLQAYYQLEQQQNSASLERAWKRVSVRLSRNHEHTRSSQQPLAANMARFPQERTRMVRNHVSANPRKGSFARSLSVLAAALVVAALVGGLVAVLNLSQRGSITGSQPVTASPTVPAAAPTPTPMPIGTTLYATPANQWGFNGLSWSPDSKRVASATVDPKGVQIWDATTGDHLVTVQLPGGANEWAYGLDWSPTSQDIAVATNQEVLIVDGQTGKIVRTYPSGTAAVSGSTISGKTFFSSRFPASGGLGYRATIWSPNGLLVASALSSGLSGEVQVWNPQTGATDFTLTLSGSYNIGALSWSSDGQYIAASTWNTQASNPLQPNSMVVVWKVSTNQIVFQHNDYLNSNAVVVWQPRSHNLAFVGATHQGSNLVATLEIWNATSGKLVQQYVVVCIGPVVWSPGGTYLACAGYVGKGAENAVMIMNAVSGKRIYVYAGHRLPVSVIAWSPNGVYIVSGEGNTQGRMVAKVWVA